MSNIAAKKFIKAQDSVAGLRFLVVDDHKFSRHIVIEALKWLSATNITEACDAAEAIGVLQGAASFDRSAYSSELIAKRLELSDDRIFGQGKFDCIITDFNMIPLNGLHLLKSVRTGEAKCARDTPVLMLTGFSDDFLIGAALELDVNAFVLKPVSRDTFSEKLGRVLMRPVEPQSVETYAAVEIPEGNDSTVYDDPVSQAAPTNQEAIKISGKMEVINISEIEDDSILAEDIVLGENVKGPNGAILIHGGTRLTGLLLEKLQELHDMGMLPESLKIER